MMGCELLRGRLDGRRWRIPEGASAEERLYIRNPTPFTLQSSLIGPVVMTRLIYHRSHIKDGTVYYVFEGYLT
jgi:hypothetical protein